MNLSEAAFDILACLSTGPKHGYAMILEIKEIREGKSMQPGLLYTTLSKLLSEKLIEKIEGGVSENKRRKYYKITSEGMKALKNEAESRLARIQNIYDIALRGEKC